MIDSSGITHELPAARGWRHARVIIPMLGAAMSGLGLAYWGWVLVGDWYNAHCYFAAAHQPQLCKTLTESPPWILLSSIVAAPGVLLTWYWRTIQKDTDIQHKQHELQLAEREHARQLRESQARATEIQEQITLQKTQIDRAGEQHWEQARAREKELDAQCAAAAVANETARDTQRLDMFVRALDSLSSDDQPKRLAGVALVAQVGRESEKYRAPALEALAAFIRTHGSVERYNEPDDTRRSMVGVAFDALASIPKSRTAQVNLRGIVLTNWSVRDGDLRGVVLAGSIIKNVSFIAVQMKNASFAECVGTDVSFFQCHCENASFSAAKFERFTITGSSFNTAMFDDARVDFQSSTPQGNLEHIMYSRRSVLTLKGHPLNPEALKMVRLD